MTVHFFSNYTMTIAGLDAPADSSFAAFNPATEDVIATVSAASRDQLEAAVAAKQTFPTWSAQPLAIRQAAGAALGAAIEAHAEDFTRLLTHEQGKARAGAEWETAEYTGVQTLVIQAALSVPTVMHGSEQP